VPALPATLQAKQPFAQAVWQQTPCSHSPEAHSAAVAQVPPSGFGPEQAPFMQKFGGWQSAFVVQRSRQASPEAQR
jgi:hypothetical protein